MNELPSGYKCTQSFLKATLYSAHGSAYHFRFRNPTRSEMIKRFVTSKIISKVNDNASCLVCFKQNNKNFLIWWIILSLKLHTNFANRLWNF